jgi:hypothetical protein
MQQIIFWKMFGQGNFRVKVKALFYLSKYSKVPTNAHCVWVKVLYGFLTLSVCRASLTGVVSNIVILFFFLSSHEVVELRGYRKLLAYFPEPRVDDVPALKVQVDLAQLPWRLT